MIHCLTLNTEKLAKLLDHVSQEGISGGVMPGVLLLSVLECVFLPRHLQKKPKKFRANISHDHLEVRFVPWLFSPVGSVECRSRVGMHHHFCNPDS